MGSMISMDLGEGDHLLEIDVDRNALVTCVCGRRPVKVSETETGSALWRCGTASVRVGL